MTSALRPATLSLTFDDGPDPVWTERVLELLAELEVRASFFMVGERVQAHPAPARAVLAAGHDVQLHCHRHVRHSECGEREIDDDTTDGLAALGRIGVAPLLWRTPWGVQTPASAAVARRHELRLVRWAIDTRDWRGDSPATMLARARRRMSAGGAVLMHDALGPGARRGSCENTVALLPMLVATAHERGLDVVPLVGVESADAHRRASSLLPR